MSTTVYLYDNVFLDKEYRNISNIRVSTSTRTPVKSYSGLTFQRAESEIINSGSPRLAGTIRLPLNNDLEVLRKCGYMTFQNSGDIKYYAFIDEVNYINAGNVEIRYTIDDFQTYLTDYLNNWTDKCFVEQEHINRSEDIAKDLDGTTQNISAQNLIWDTKNYYEYRISNLYFISLAILYDEALINELKKIGFTVYEYSNRTTVCVAYINNSIITREIIKGLVDVLNNAERYKYVLDCVASCFPFEVSTKNTKITTNINLYPDKYGDYSFKNAILGTYPFYQLTLKSSTGETISINPKDCESSDDEKMIVNVSYGDYLQKEATASVEPDVDNSYFTMPSTNKLVSFPIGSTIPVNREQLLNFISTNAASSVASVTTGVGSVLGGAILLKTGVGAGVGIPMILSGAGSILGTLGTTANQLTNAIEPTGKVSSSYGNLLARKSGFEIIANRPTNMETKMLDDYFSMYGYVTNKVKIPNIKNRNNFNFVKCHDISNFRGVPPRAKTAMTNAFSKGVFIWHNLGQIGNYDIDTNG